MRTINTDDLVEDVCDLHSTQVTVTHPLSQSLPYVLVTIIVIAVLIILALKFIWITIIIVINIMTIINLKVTLSNHSHLDPFSMYVVHKL